MSDRLMRRRDRDRASERARTEAINDMLRSVARNSTGWPGAYLLEIAADRLDELQKELDALQQAANKPSRRLP